MRIATPVDLLVLNKKNEILLLRRKEKEDQFVNHWSIPGGGPKLGETFEEALRREIKEEINCQINKMDYFKSFYFKVNEDLHVLALYFYGNILGDIELNKEFSEFKWFSFKELSEKNIPIAFNQKEIILDFIKFLRKNDAMGVLNEN